MNTFHRRLTKAAKKVGSSAHTLSQFVSYSAEKLAPDSSSHEPDYRAPPLLSYAHHRGHTESSGGLSGLHEENEDDSFVEKEGGVEVDGEWRTSASPSAKQPLAMPRTEPMPRRVSQVGLEGSEPGWWAKPGRGVDYLVMCVKEARDLGVVDYDTHSTSSYVKVSVGDPSKPMEARTRVCHRNRHPMWEQCFFFPLESCTTDTRVSISVYGRSAVNTEHFSGHVLTTLGHLLEPVTEVIEPAGAWYRLTPRRPSDTVSGDLRVSFMLLPRNVYDLVHWSEDAATLLDPQMLHSLLRGYSMRVALQEVCSLRLSRKHVPGDPSAFLSKLHLQLRVGRCSLDVKFAPKDVQTSMVDGDPTLSFSIDETVVFPLLRAFEISHTWKTKKKDRDEVGDIKVYLMHGSEVLAKTQVPVWDMPLMAAESAMALERSSTITEETEEEQAAMQCGSVTERTSSLSTGEPSLELAPEAASPKALAPAEPASVSVSCGAKKGWRMAAFDSLARRLGNEGRPCAMCPIARLVSSSMHRSMSGAAHAAGFGSSPFSTSRRASADVCLLADMSMDPMAEWVAGRPGSDGASELPAAPGPVSSAPGVAGSGAKAIAAAGAAAGAAAATGAPGVGGGSPAGPLSLANSSGNLEDNAVPEATGLGLLRSYSRAPDAETRGCVYARTMQVYSTDVMRASPEIKMCMQLIPHSSLDDDVASDATGVEQAHDDYGDEAAPDSVAFADPAEASAAPTPIVPPPALPVIAAEVLVAGRPDKVFETAFASDSAFQTRMTSNEGLKDVKWAAWAGKQRTVTYIRPISIPLPFSPKQCNVLEVHTIPLKEAGSFVLRKKVTTDAPKGDLFFVDIQVVGVAEGAHHTRVRVSFQVEFVKAAGMLRGVIEAGAISGTKKLQEEWASALAREFKANEHAIAVSAGARTASGASSQAVGAAAAAAALGDSAFAPRSGGGDSAGAARRGGGGLQMTPPLLVGACLGVILLLVLLYIGSGVWAVARALERVADASVRGL